jgi:HTH-type transcriptional regulator, sugar sensing transcriptional regulator
MEAIETLIKTGLSETESRVYLAALELGPALYSAVAEKAGIKRPTLYYEVLPNLIDKGLLIETVKGKRKYLVAQDMQPFLENKKDQLKEAELLVPQLRSLLATASSKPTLLLYEGVEGIKKVWFDHLVQNQPILELVGIEDIHPELQKYIKNYYIIERTKRKIPLKMLVSGPTVAGIFKVKSDPYELREVKNINGSIFPVPLGCDIYGDNVSFTLHRKDSEPLGLVIRSKEIATTMRSVFNFIWEQV